MTSKTASRIGCTRQLLRCSIILFILSTPHPSNANAHGASIARPLSFLLVLLDRIAYSVDELGCLLTS